MLFGTVAAAHAHMVQMLPLKLYRPEQRRLEFVPVVANVVSETVPFSDTADWGGTHPART